MSRFFTSNWTDPVTFAGVGDLPGARHVVYGLQEFAHRGSGLNPDPAPVKRRFPLPATRGLWSALRWGLGNADFTGFVHPGVSDEREMRVISVNLGDDKQAVPGALERIAVWESTSEDKGSVDATWVDMGLCALLAMLKSKGWRQPESEIVRHLADDLDDLTALYDEARWFERMRVAAGV